MISTHVPHQQHQQGTTSKYFLNPPAKPSSPPEATLYANPNFTTMPPTPPSNNTSPSESLHHAHLNVRQVRQPRQPLYVPAALRPTDPPTRPTTIPNRPRAPDTPPASKDNSFDSAKSGQLSRQLTGEADSVTTLTQSPEASLDFDQLRRGLSRAGSDCLSLDAFPAVTGPPTTAHWKPDSSSPSCTICQLPFSFWFRRHHCRSCGDVVCDGDSRRKIPLDENARYNGNGTAWRACDRCAGEWDLVQKLRLSRPLSEPERGAGAGLPIPRRPSLADPSMAQSFARSQGAMEWSTF